MGYKSLFPDLEIPKCNVLSFLFPQGKQPSDQAIWIDAADPRHFLTPRLCLSWVRRLGFGLDRLGIGRQQVVMIFTPNHIFVPVAYLGIVGSGRIFSAANPVYTVNEVEYQIKNTGASCIFVHPDHVETAVEAARRAGLDQSKIFQFSDKPCQTKTGVRDWREAMAGSQSEAESWQWDSMTETSTTNIATINYSSGTTGLPKGVCISHHNLLANVVQTIFMRDLEQPYNKRSQPQERWVGFLPLYHAYGQLYVNLIAPTLLFPTYVMKKFVYEDFLGVIQTHQITNLQVAPPILIMLDKRPETVRYDLSSVNHILCGAAPLSKELQRAVAKKVDCNIIQGWGMTEVTCGSLLVPGGRYDESGSVGLILPNHEFKLLDDDGKEVAEGQPGEMFVRAPNVCVGYWRNEQATKESLDSGGWLKTGDIAVVKDNWFWIVDRKKELIKVNALQVAPAELEAVLLENGDVADAAVTGITLGDEEWPRAYVSLKDKKKGQVTETQIQEWMKGKVAKHKQLVGGVKFVDEVPKLASGKIQRKVVREWAKRDALELEKGGRPRL
ncbi:uncharacterized protein A1O9_10085 [Exophiala aquamarina CBS 119918]|uniref:4-coumarate-CoA ligase n=1 Tax=Exophiala aquamarina CBS 119918 TaxID=1182545 RepID=A0A072PDP5_9EURO|nr:uncharacterized protein A1O9_10085 [Exophiala aquamarina CBS 119918]KEF53685.1 hypothetical protein A1O9_10085 [Exophiala aquamarina CBS 119918]